MVSMNYMPPVSLKVLPEGIDELGIAPENP
jgi:hypothetical protein